MKPKVLLKLEKRLKRRNINEQKLAQLTPKQALAEKDWVARTKHGGNVEYDWRRTNLSALTECAVAISDPEGLTLVIVNACDAFGPVSDRKIASSCVPGSEDLWDRRIKKESRRASAWEELKQVHAENFSAMEKLAATAD